MAREFFKNLPNQTTPLTAPRLNGLLDGDEAMGNVVVDSIRCKNILLLQNASTTVMDVSISVNEGTITVNGTATADAVYDIPIISTISTSEGTLTKSFDKSGTYTGIQTSLRTGDGAISAGLWSNNLANATGTLSANATKLRIEISNGTSVNATFKPMVEKGTSATTYAPHQALGYVSGSNANGSYIKYDDGTLIQWGTKIVGSVAITSARGNMYSSSSQTAITFPIEFNASPDYINLQSRYGDNFYWVVQINNPTKANTGSYYLLSPTSYTDGNVRIGFHAIGRWK